MEGLAEGYPGDEYGLFASAPVLESEPIQRLVAEHRNVVAEELQLPPDAEAEAEVAEEADDGSTEPAGQTQPPRVGPLRAALRQVGVLAWLYRRLRGMPEPEPDPEPEPQHEPEPDPTFYVDEALLQRLAAYDLVYLAWPYFIEAPELPRPAAATFHDFNYKHEFGNYSPERIELLDRQIPRWLRMVAATIVSTDFIEGELRRFYPEETGAVDVIPLASFATSIPSAEDTDGVRARFGLPSRYILYPCNIARHKNLARLFRAHALVREADPYAPPLVLCGWGTDLIAQQALGTIAASDGYLESLAQELRALYLGIGADVHLLGYVSDAEVDALIVGATLVISASTYEAGSGPALDAWLLGSPVALSRIPSHCEQLERLGTEAWLFDPADPADIAAVIGEALRADGTERVRRSIEALHRYDWSVVAGRYHAAFKRALASHAGKRG